MALLFTRLLQLAAWVGMLALSSLGVEISGPKELAPVDGRGKLLPVEEKIGTVVPVLLQSVVQAAKNASKIVCEDKTYVAEFLACGEEIGRSAENRPIYVFRIGSESGQNRINVLLIGGLHTGTEKNTYNLASKVLQYYYGKPERVPENTTLYIIPKINPDGIALGTHNNARNVDLNRNWPTDDWRSDPYHPTYGNHKGAGGSMPLSESETFALYSFITKLPISAVGGSGQLVIFTWHSQAGTVDGNEIGIANESAKIYAQAAGYKYIDRWSYYETTGTLLDAMRESGIAAVDVELSSRKTEFDKNIKGVNASLNFIGNE